MSWHHCPQTTLRLICALRRSRHHRKHTRERFGRVALWLHRYHSKTLAYNVKAFAEFGCLKDLLEILYRIVNGPKVRYNQIMERKRVRRRRQQRMMVKTTKSRRKQHNVLMEKRLKSKVMQKRRRKLQKRRMEKRMSYKVMLKRKVMHLRNRKRVMMARKAIKRYNYDSKYRFLHDQISSLFAELLKADLEYLISGQITKISLASKWCPSLDSSYDRSTLICESVARRLFQYDSCPEYRGVDESHYVYRVRDRLRKEYLVPLRRALKLPEIYMCANKWDKLQYDRITPTAMETYKRLFYKHDRERFLQYLQKVECRTMSKTITKELFPYEILNLFGYVSVDEVELQWKKMINAYSEKGKFLNCISVADVNLFRSTYDCRARFSLAFILMTSELCASPWKGKVLTYSINPEFVNIEGDDLGSKINFLRSLPVCEHPKSVQLVDKILETAKDLKLSKENMIERVFVCDELGLCNHYLDWDKEPEVMREKYERNGYVMPDIVDWGLLGESEANFKIFLEGDGAFNVTVMLESKICSEDYLKLVVYD
ncbi:hypothetical protein FH972_009421 [Carpinus fangiana]|uniref:Uncharacterized protein n=1 Tax=Carpinus fangiana TaxID=176857 RepID=A0A5N6R1U3_9ROSI|nr:hypothetical protein FH972_009421 [Carpinus fangiana]KAE8023754.1 hypothetical protein FH972_009421 [Carpinus fangiana]